jgi:hypothetical protein
VVRETASNVELLRRAGRPVRSGAALALVAAAGAVAVTAALAAPRTEAQTRIFRFQTPSRNIGCVYSSATGRPAYLRCDVLSGLKPKPKTTCRLDWTGYSMTASGKPRATCAGDTVYDRRAQIFPYTWPWSRGGFTCTVQRAGLRCKNATGRGFFLSRTRSYAF